MFFRLPSRELENENNPIIISKYQIFTYRRHIIWVETCKQMRGQRDSQRRIFLKFFFASAFRMNFRLKRYILLQFFSFFHREWFCCMQIRLYKIDCTRFDDDFYSNELQNCFSNWKACLPRSEVNDSAVVFLSRRLMKIKCVNSSNPLVFALLQHIHNKVGGETWTVHVPTRWCKWILFNK